MNLGQAHSVPHRKCRVSSFLGLPSPTLFPLAGFVLAQPLPCSAGTSGTAAGGSRERVGDTRSPCRVQLERPGAPCGRGRCVRGAAGRLGHLRGAPSGWVARTGCTPSIPVGPSPAGALGAFYPLHLLLLLAHPKAAGPGKAGCSRQAASDSPLCTSGVVSRCSTSFADVVDARFPLFSWRGVFWTWPYPANNCAGGTLLTGCILHRGRPRAPEPGSA